MRGLLGLLLFLLPGVAGAAEPLCGPDAPCEIEGGGYHMLAPDGWDGRTPLPAVIYFHGHRSSGASIFRSRAMRREFADKGYLVIAPNGAQRPGTEVRAWPARPGGGARDDVAFTLDVLADAGARVPLARERVYVAGFSAGGSMAWMMACYAGQEFAGFVSVAGALRRPLPREGCSGGPVRLLQIHGYSDRQVPLEGRGIGSWHQGDVFEALGLARAVNGCRTNPDSIEVEGPYWCRDWTGCSAGAVSMCLHPGGHGLPKGWAAMARDWFEAD